MIARKPSGLEKPKTKPIPNNLSEKKIGLEAKCRFCKHLDPVVDWVEEELHLCNKSRYLYNDVDNTTEETECSKFEWADELKGKVE